MRGAAAEQALVVRAVQIDVAFERVASRPAVDAVLDPVEREDAGEDQVVGASLAAPCLAGRLARGKYRAGLGVAADAPRDDVPAGRGAV